MISDMREIIMCIFDLIERLSTDTFHTSKFLATFLENDFTEQKNKSTVAHVIWIPLSPL